MVAVHAAESLLMCSHNHQNQAQCPDGRQALALLHQHSCVALLNVSAFGERAQQAGCQQHLQYDTPSTHQNCSCGLLFSHAANLSSRIERHLASNSGSIL